MPTNREAYFEAIKLGVPKTVVDFALCETNGFNYLELTKNNEEITSGKLYEEYQSISKKDAVTYRRIFDFINELELLGIISTNTISRGRGKGRTNIIKLQCDEELLETTLFSI